MRLMQLLRVIPAFATPVWPARLLAIVYWLSIPAFPAIAAPPAPVVSAAPGGRVTFHADAFGNRVPDFATAGYAGGERAIPEATVQVVVAPTFGDGTERIQRAIDYVATRPADSNGVRGAVLLLKGHHRISGGLVVTNSGIILRGQGPGEEGTVLVATGVDRRTLIRFAGRDEATLRSNASWKIKSQVSVGATRLQLESTDGLKPGDRIRIIRPSTQQWIEKLGATEFGGGIGGGWKPGSRDIIWDRVVKTVEGEFVSIDAPVTTALEVPGPEEAQDSASQSRTRNPPSTIRQLEIPYVVICSQPGEISNVGVENLALESEYDAGNPRDENHSWCAITMENTADAWVRQVTFRHFAGSAVALYESCRRVTVQDCLSLQPVSEIGGYRRHTFFTMGQQTLFLRCYAESGRHDFSVGHCAAGPNAFVQCEASQPFAESGPIESWASGVLYDNVVIDGHALSLGFRPGNNAAVGWAAANSVLWNCSASVIRCWNPPGAQNWSFGSWASFEGDGVWRSSNDFMKPDSLFAAQVKDRFGVEAEARLQLMPRPREESSNPPLDKAQELAAAAHQPPPQLKDYILDAGQRDPIPDDAGNAILIETLSPVRAPAPRASRSPLQVTNGWLTVNGKLLIGSTAGVTWWRGSIRPTEAENFGRNVTRFVPGRIGKGFTDDLNELAGSLVGNGYAALDHNYGLWYDRRRDDHERVRRINGDVLPPFYEQPFARSGQGTAWDGLSKYDLTKFNPWYWARLREFAELCEERGLVLYHQNYFQHNILEAGAHWADFPWRSANNVNETGFPEPPPYAGDKRIFQAELFYDVNHPKRRELHRGYIRQCLDNFTNQANVIQFTSAEFTGPLPFTQFWLDTIADWEHELAVAQTSKSAVSQVSKPANVDDSSVPRNIERAADLEIGGTAGLETCATSPLIALSCTKDVQDAILADLQRSATVDVIDFRYWWRTDRGEFAPPGGKNLAPRQFERQWRGGRPNDENLAAMAAEYRAKYPTKPLICDFDAASWAWVCAGGSMPRLPKTTDARLLSAIRQMQPWLASSEEERWGLREAGRQMLIYGGGELDLSGETGSFRVNVVNARTGEVTTGEIVKAGGKVKLPDATIVWLTNE